MATSKSEKVRRLVDETYAATLDPLRYEDLLAAWLDYVSQSDEAASSGSGIDDDINTHFERALAILDRMGRVKAQGDAARLMVDHMPAAAVLLSTGGKVLSANQACASLFGASMPQRLEDLKLDKSAEARFWSWARRNAGPDRSDDYIFLRTRLGNSDRPVRALMTRAALRAQPDATPEDAILLAHLDVHIGPVERTLLQDNHGLSEAETDVAIRLAKGDTPEKIANDRNAKMATVRTQIRGILAKLDVPSVTEAIRVLSGYGAAVSAARFVTENAPAITELDRQRRKAQMTLPDGRTLSWLEQGDPAGRPVLFFHHLYHGPSWTEPAIQALAHQGWRVIAPSRAGFGDSGGIDTSGLDDRVRQNVAAFAQLVERLKTGPVIVIGHASGIIHAQAFAASRPDLVRALLSVGGETSWEDGMASDFPWQHRVIATTLLRAPAAIGFLARATVAFIDNGREEYLLRALHRETPLEARVARRPEVRQVIVDGLKHVVSQGTQAFVSEIRMSMTDRRHIARQVKAPFRIIHGLQDKVYKPEMFETFASTVPGVELVPVEDAGQYLLYSHWPLVIAQMEKLWRETSRPDN
ncbi:alpha/beta fold hydrolase [Henriciella litoralis]|uniref:alpha/beta fold hydrolase n=1 Tax=Henriciella litoralis TaxID=568102 RepID=UPI00146F13BA|nr:alpha/beta fold hydrolase [Henriciella litoralis]